MTAASIRFNNPGAMWGGNAISRKWSEVGKPTVLNDGLGQGNNIAMFPDKTHGAAAQFDLWRSRYCNMTLQAAVTKWSGGNSSPQYISFLEGKTGCKAETQISASLLAGPIGLALMKAQAQWEAGQPYPLSDAEWQKAQQWCFSNRNPAVRKTVKKAEGAAAGSVVAAGTAAAAAKSGVDPKMILLGVGAAIAVAVAVWFLFFRKKG